MKKNDLRQQAEKKLGKRKTAATPLTDADTIRLVHELQVHQIELEMQNEELMQAREESEAIQRQFTDLYDFAPVGYFTLTRDGAISRVNLTGTTLLGEERSKLLTRRFGLFVSPQSRPAFSAFHEKVFSADGKKQTCEVELLKGKTESFWAQIEAVSDDSHETCRAVVIDITKRRQAEEELRESEERIRIFLDSTLDMAYLKDESFRHIIANRALCKFYDKTESEIIGRTDFDLMAEKSAAECRKTDEQTLRSNDILISEEVVRSRYYETMKFPVELAENKIGIGAYIRDITERKWTEEALRESESRFRSLYENATIGLYRTTQDGKILLANPTLVNMLGYSSFEELSSRNLEKDGFEPSYLRAKFIELIEKDGEIRGVESAWKRHDGSVISVRESARAIRDSNGKTLYYDGTVEDITERKQAEEALRTLTARQEAILSAIPDILMEVDGNKVYTWANPAGFEFFGKDVIGKKADFYFEGKQDTYNVVEPLFHGREDVVYVESWQRRKDGEKRLLAWQCRTLKDADGSVVGALSSAHDITAHKQMEDAMRFKQKMLARTEGIAHIGSWEWDVATDTVTWSDELFRIFQIDPQEGTPSFAEHPKLYPAEDMQKLRQAVDNAVSHGVPYELELHAICRDGTMRICLASGYAEMGQQGRAVRLFGSLHDITERKRAEEELRRVNRLYSTLSEANQAIVRLHDRKELFKAICQIAVEHGDFRMVWIGLIDELTGTIKPVAYFGYEDGYLEKINIVLSKDSPYSKGPIGQAALNGKIVVSDDIETALQMLPWRDEALKRGYRSSAAVPFQLNGKVIGVLNLYATEPGYFNEEQQHLLEEIGADISFALDSMAMEAERLSAEQARKEAAEALRESEEKYRLIVENAYDGIEITQHERIMFSNAQFAEMLGYTLDEIMNVNSHKIFTEQGIRELLERKKNREAGKPEPYQYETTFLKKDGTVIDVDVRYRIIDYNGESATFAIIRDVTEHRRTEEALRNSEVQFRSIWENSRDGMRLCNANGNIVRVNQAYCQMVGMTNAEMEGKPLSVIYSPETGERILALHIERFQSDTILPSFERRVTLHDGRTVWFGVSNSTIEIKDRKLQLSIFRDITERKQVEDALRVSEEKFRGIFENVQDAYYEATEEGTILEISPSIEILSKGQYRRKDLIGRSMSEFYADPERRKVLLTALKEHGAVTDFEIALRNKDGSLIPCSITSSLHLDALSHQQKIVGSIRDITRRKQVEEALRESQEQFRIAQDMSPDGFTILQPVRDAQERVVDFTWIYENDAVARLNGTDPKGVVGQRLLELFPNHRGTPILRAYQQVAESGETCILEADYSGESTPKPTSFRLVVVPMAGNIAILAQDITERKQAEKALQELNDKLTQAQRIAHVGNWENYLSTNDLHWSEEMYNIMGFSSSTSINLAEASLVFPPEELKRFQQAVSAAINENAPYSMDYKIVRLDGSVRYIHDEGEVIRDEHGQAIWMYGTTQDITERKIAEEQIRYQAYLLQNVFDAIIASDADGRIKAWNNAAERIYGWKAIELLGQKFHDILQPEYLNQSREEVFDKIDRDGIWSGEMIHHCKDGKTIAVQSTISVLKDSAGNLSGTISVNHDITERKQAEKIKKSLEAQLQHAQKLESLGTLVSGIAHDFNNILAIIIGHASLIEMKGVKTGQETNSLQAIQKTGQRGATLVKQLLTFARKTEPSLQAVSINQIIEELMKLIAETFPKIIEVKIQKGKVPFILGDADQLHQVLLNLCVNARDAMPEGGSLTIQTDMLAGDAVSLLLPQASASEYVRIKISDTGTGMSEATIKRIFDPFFTMKDIGKGTGLGLSIVYGIVTEHHGFILVDSALGKGTAFTVYLPVPQDAESLEISTDHVKENIVGGNETILIVEDEEMVQDFLKEVLEKKGYHVETAVDGKAALQKYGEQGSKIDLIISDIGLPIINGIELFERLIVANPQVKVIIASGYIEPDKRSDLLSRGLKAFIQKPYKPMEVWTRVREALDEPL